MIFNSILYNETELKLFNNEGKLYMYDLCLDKFIIEFDGDFWHANPKIMNENEIHPVKKIKNSEIINHDKYKFLLAEKNGYNIIRIWESEYLENKEQTFNKILKFLNKK